MSRRQRLLTLVSASILGIAGLITATPAQAVNTTPSDLYFPATGANGSSCNGAPSQNWQDGSGNQLNQYSPGLVGANGYTVTIHNLCPGTIYIYYGEATP